MNPAILNSQFVQVALPIVVTLVATIRLASWSQNKRFDDIGKRIDELRTDMNVRFGEVSRRLDKIDGTLSGHSEKIAALDERTSLFGRRG